MTAATVDHVSVLIIVFGMPDCGACEEYVPRLLKRVGELQRQGYRFTIYEPGKAIAAGSIPVLVYDVASEDSELQALADRYSVNATPTTIVQSRGGNAFKAEGALDAKQIDALLGLAFQRSL